jgi:hypothetical protein
LILSAKCRSGNKSEEWCFNRKSAVLPESCVALEQHRTKKLKKQIKIK